MRHNSYLLCFNAVAASRTPSFLLLPRAFLIFLLVTLQNTRVHETFRGLELFADHPANQSICFLLLLPENVLIHQSPSWIFFFVFVLCLSPVQYLSQRAQ